MQRSNSDVCLYEQHQIDLCASTYRRASTGYKRKRYVLRCRCLAQVFLTVTQSADIDLAALKFYSMTSEKSRLSGGSLALGFNLAILTQIAYLAESRVCKAAGHNQNFLRAFEGGQHDCGLFKGSPSLGGGTLTSKIFKLSRSYNDEDDLIIPLEVKNPGPTGDYQRNVSWRFEITESQVNRCQALIITSPKEPGFVVLLPMHYHRQRAVNLQRGGGTYRPLWSLHPLPAFPPEWSPFVLPMSQLVNALTNMLDYANGSTAAW